MAGLGVEAIIATAESMAALRKNVRYIARAAWLFMRSNFTVYYLSTIAAHIGTAYKKCAALCTIFGMVPCKGCEALAPPLAAVGYADSGPHHTNQLWEPRP